jgi:CRP-like cAMP-binding protein
MADFLDAMPLLAALDEDERAELRLAAVPFAATQGERIFRQGDPPTCLYLLERGELEIATRIPGDPAASVSRIEPGEAVGEFALLDPGPRSASVSALADSSGLVLGRDHFLAMVTEGRPAAIKLLDALRVLTARRTLATLHRIGEGSGAARCELRAFPADSKTPEGAAQPVAAALVTTLSAFSGLALDDAARLLAEGEAVDVARGVLLAPAEAAPDGIFLVLRGAVRAGLPRAHGLEQVMIHAPGDFAGLTPVFADQPYPLSLSAAEPSRLLRIGAAQFHEWRTDRRGLARAAMEAAGRQLVRDQRRANRHLGRALALGRFNRAGSVA